MILLKQHYILITKEKKISHDFKKIIENMTSHICFNIKAET